MDDPSTEIFARLRSSSGSGSPSSIQKPSSLLAILDIDNDLITHDIKYHGKMIYKIIRLIVGVVAKLVKY